MLRPESAARRDIVTDCAIAIVAESGMAGLTFQSLARRIGVTRAGIHHWVGSRRAMDVTLTACFGQRWIPWIWRRSHSQGALALLPTTEEEVGWTRVWLAITELARTHDEVAEVVTAFRAEERAILARLRPDLGAEDLVAACALVDGLRLAVFLRDRPLDPVSARAILARALDRWSTVR